ncbi:MAG: hypothetical protein IJ587_06885 [Synergistaceae bacterium]|nr:hypothetical protein [Synergistaceae bacterium]
MRKNHSLWKNPEKIFLGNTSKTGFTRANLSGSNETQDNKATEHFLRKESSIIMKNTDTSGNKIRNIAQRTTRNVTKCMTQSTFQKKILDLVQQAGDKVAEAMNIVDEAGTIAGINVHFERGERSKLTERNEQSRWNQQDEWSDHRTKHPRHLDDDLCNRDGRNNHVDASDIFYEANEADAHAENYEADEADYSDEINEVTIP